MTLPAISRHDWPARTASGLQWPRSNGWRAPAAQTDRAWKDAQS
jgi:hypothetical protein